MDQILRQLGELLLGAVPPSSFWGRYTSFIRSSSIGRLSRFLPNAAAAPRERWKKRAPTSPRPKPALPITSNASAKPARKSSRAGSPAPASQPVSAPSRPTSPHPSSGTGQQARAALEGDKQQRWRARIRRIPAGDRNRAHSVAPMASPARSWPMKTRTRTKRLRKAAWIALLELLCSGIPAPAPPTASKTASTSAQQESSQPKNEAAPAHQSIGGELVKETREAAGRRPGRERKFEARSSDSMVPHIAECA